ncbi:MAG TPA: DUF885 domain-containing protein [Mycobacteriales bacterium]|nr:DUF885 domain-containing protein [Mycobacteriales bacterium]
MDLAPFDLAREYVLLGLRFDRIETGFVDAYTGDPRLRQQVQDEPPPEPAALARRARELIAELPASGLPVPRQEYLRGQLTALECGARKFADEPVGFIDEVEAYFQVRPELGDQDTYRAAHAELDRVLPGSGDLAERLGHLRRREDCPPERLEEVVAAFASALRDRVRGEYGLPQEETVDFQIVTDKPWSGFNYYLGRYRSEVAINADQPHRFSQLPHLVAHEAYPGHHTEHCRKERGLVEGEGHLEHTIFLVNTPECLMAEGLADLGLTAAIGVGWGKWAAEILADLGLALDGEQAEIVSRASAGLLGVRQDAAIMLHDRGAAQEDVIAYLSRWLLVSPERAGAMLRFLSHPLWRAYTSTYVEGYRLLSAWLADRPDGQSAAGRFGRLLDEPLTPAVVAAELAS